MFKYLFSEVILLSIIKEYLHLIKRYNLYKVLACLTTFFQLSLFCATFFHFLTFMLFMSSKTSSCQRVLGLPICLLGMGFHLCYRIYLLLLLLLLLFMVELKLPMCTPQRCIGEWSCISVNFLEPSGLVQACNGTALPCFFYTGFYRSCALYLCL